MSGHGNEQIDLFLNSSDEILLVNNYIVGQHRSMLLNVIRSFKINLYRQMK